PARGGARPELRADARHGDAAPPGAAAAGVVRAEEGRLPRALALGGRRRAVSVVHGMTRRASTIISAPRSGRPRKRRWSAKAGRQSRGCERRRPITGRSQASVVALRALRSSGVSAKAGGRLRAVN